MWHRSALSLTFCLRLSPTHRANVTVDVMITDHAGAPVGGNLGCECTFYAVDESVLFLSDYKVKDPIASFYQNRDKCFKVRTPPCFFQRLMSPVSNPDCSCLSFVFCRWCRLAAR